MSEDLLTPGSEVILSAKSEDKLEIEKEELLLERLKEADSRDDLDQSPDGDKTEESSDYKECIMSNEEIAKKKFKIPNVQLKTPKVPGFLKGPKKDASPKSEDGLNEGQDGDEPSKVPAKDRVKEMLDKMPKLSKPAFMKKNREPDEEENPEEPSERSNFLKKVPGLLKKKKDEPQGEDEQDESPEGGDEGQKRSMKPAALAVLESIRSAAQHMPTYFKKRPENADQKKDLESGVEDTEEKRELLDKKKQLDRNKAVPEDDLEEIKINNDDDPEKPSRKGVEQQMSRVKEVSRQCSEQFMGLDTRRKIALLAIFIGIILLILIIALAAGSSPARWTNEIRFIGGGKYVEAHTSCGTVVGLVEAPDQLRFTGIPYAANKSNRFEQSHIASNLEECFSQNFVAYMNETASCMGKTNKGIVEGEEECLTLNIYTSSVVYDEFMPVVVYIRGDDVDPTLSPSTELSKKMRVVFVEVNYRFGSLGFLSNDVLSRRSYPHTSGNYGLGDIITALKWIRLNIQHFGGHPKKVTLLGSGFGGTLVTALTSSRLAKGFYHGIWATNGAGSFANRTLEQVSQDNEKIVKKLFCGPDVQRCLINADAEVLTENIPEEWLTSSTNQLPIMGEKDHSWIVVDKHILTHHPVSYWRKYASDVNVPMVFGATEHVEATESNFKLMDWEDRDIFEAHVEEKLGSFNVTLPGLALSFYNTSDNWIDYISMLSDIRTVCPIMNLAEMASVNSNTNVYSYVASQRKSTDLGQISDASSDVAAIFGLYEPVNRTETHFVNNVQELFYSFVKHGSLPYGDRDVALGYYEINSKVSFRHEPRSTCQFWENVNHIVPEYANLD